MRQAHVLLGAGNPQRTLSQISAGNLKLEATKEIHVGNTRVVLKPDARPRSSAPKTAHFDLESTTSLSENKDSTTSLSENKDSTKRGAALHCIVFRKTDKVIKSNQGTGTGTKADSMCKYCCSGCSVELVVCLVTGILMHKAKQTDGQIAIGSCSTV